MGMNHVVLQGTVVRAYEPDKTYPDGSTSGVFVLSTTRGGPAGYTPVTDFHRVRLNSAMAEKHAHEVKYGSILSVIGFLSYSTAISVAGGKTPTCNVVARRIEAVVTDELGHATSYNAGIAFSDEQKLADAGQGV